MRDLRKGKKQLVEELSLLRKRIAELEKEQNQFDQDGTRELSRTNRRLKRTEQNLLRERDFSNSIIKSLPEHFYIIDSHRKFVRWNKDFETGTGYSSKEISPMPPTTFFDVSEKAVILQKIQDVLGKGEASVEADMVSKGHGARHE